MLGGCLRGSAEIVAASRPPQRADVRRAQKFRSCSCPGSIGTCLQAAPDLSGGSCALRGHTVRRREKQKKEETKLLLFVSSFVTMVTRNTEKVAVTPVKGVVFLPLLSDLFTEYQKERWCL